MIFQYKIRFIIIIILLFYFLEIDLTMIDNTFIFQHIMIVNCNKS